MNLFSGKYSSFLLFLPLFISSQQLITRLEYSCRQNLNFRNLFIEKIEDIAPSQRFINCEAKIMVFENGNVIENDIEFKEQINLLEQVIPGHITLVAMKKVKDYLFRQDLMLITLNSWKIFQESHHHYLKEVPSILIVKP